MTLTKTQLAVILALAFWAGFSFARGWYEVGDSGRVALYKDGMDDPDKIIAIYPQDAPEIAMYNCNWDRDRLPDDQRGRYTCAVIE